MKFVLSCIIYFFYIPFLMAQNQELPADLFQDIVIQTIKDQLPQDWEIVVDKDLNTFSLVSKYTVWQTHENQINAPVDRRTAAEIEKYFYAYGKELRAEITFELHQPWRPIELKNIHYNESNFMFYYANSQYFGLKVVKVEGISGDDPGIAT